MFIIFDNIIICDLSDETWFEKFGEGKSLEYSFWATRIKR